MTAFIGRREFITMIGGATVAWPLAVRAQQPAMPVIGYLSVGSPIGHLLGVFKQSVAEAGFVGGAMWRSRPLRPMATTIVCPRWLPIWCDAK